MEPAVKWYYFYIFHFALLIHEHLHVKTSMAGRFDIYSNANDGLFYFEVINWRKSQLSN